MHYHKQLSALIVKYFVGCLNLTGVKKFHATTLAQFKQAENLFNDWLLIRGSKGQTIVFNDVSL